MQPDIRHRTGKVVKILYIKMFSLFQNDIWKITTTTVISSPLADAILVG